MGQHALSRLVVSVSVCEVIGEVLCTDTTHSDANARRIILAC